MKKIIVLLGLLACGLTFWAGSLPVGPLAHAQDAPALSPMPATDEAHALIRAAAGQVGVVTIYDPAYVTLDFPGGDVDPDRGVCTDVLIRALRLAQGIDLQAAVNRDMRANFAAYPRQWGLTKPDRNIDHRRVPNLRRLLERVGAEVTGDPLPGDVVTVLLPGNLAHVLIVSDQMGASAPMIIHNIGAGTQVEDRLYEFEQTGHYRLTPEVLARLRALQG